MQAIGTFLPGAKHAIQIPLQEEGIFNVQTGFTPLVQPAEALLRNPGTTAALHESIYTETNFKDQKIGGSGFLPTWTSG